jgi:hypothetical protein
VVFCPNGAQGDSPGQRPGFDGPESYQALKGRNLSERQPIRLPYPGRRFALPWAISFCPFGAGKSQPYRVRTVPGFAIAQDWRTPAAEKTWNCSLVFRETCTAVGPRTGLRSDWPGPDTRKKELQILRRRTPHIAAGILVPVSAVESISAILEQVA